MALLLCAITGCNKENDDATMKKITVAGKVLDIDGKPLSGVSITSGSAKTVTASDGTFSLKKAEVVNKRLVVKIEHSSYFPLVRSEPEQSEIYFEAVLIRKGNSDCTLQTHFDASKEINLELQGMKIDLPPSCLLNADGSAYSGNVTVDLLYLSPHTPNYCSMKHGGDGIGVCPNGVETLFISYGSFHLILTDNAGKLLQLKQDARVTLAFPVPEGATYKPQKLPVWTFKKGIYKATGIATLEGNEYVLRINSLAKEDLAPLVSDDDLAPLVSETGPITPKPVNEEKPVEPPPKPTVTIKGKVVDCNNKPADAYIRILAADGIYLPTAPYDYASQKVWTNSKGEWQATVAKGMSFDYQVKYWKVDEPFESENNREHYDRTMPTVKLCDEEEKDGEGLGALSVNGQVYNFYKATHPASATTLASVLRLHTHDNVNSGNLLDIALINVPLDLPLGTYSHVPNMSAVGIGAIELKINGKITACFDADAVLVVAKTGNKYKLTLTGTMLFLDDPTHLHSASLTYEGTIKFK